MQEHEEKQAALMHRRKNKSQQKENNRNGTIDRFLEFAFFFFSGKACFIQAIERYKIVFSIFKSENCLNLPLLSFYFSPRQKKKNGANGIQIGKEMKRHVSWGFPVKRLKFYRLRRKLAGMHSLARIWRSYYLKSPTFHKCG